MAKKKEKSATVPGLKDIDFWLKLFGLGALFTGGFGLGFQKGMISMMGLGNLNGNYELREVFNSALFGLYHVFTIAKETVDSGVTVAWREHLVETIIIFCLFGFLIALLLITPNGKIKNRFKSASSVLERLFRPSSYSLLIYPIFSGILALPALFVLLWLRYMLVAVSAFLLAIMLAGYFVGESKIKRELADDVCHEVDDELRQRNDLRQCTQIVIDGRSIMGVVMLENQEGYFIKRNDAFAYIKKDGSGCIYSKFVLKTEVDYSKQRSVDFSSVDRDLTEYCRVSIPNKER